MTPRGREPLTAEQAKTVAFRVGSAMKNRRLYASDNPTLLNSLEQLASGLDDCFHASGIDSLAIALIQDGLSVAGIPLIHLGEQLGRLATQMRERGLEIITIDKSAKPAELETLLTLLNVDVPELIAVDIGQWLLDRGARHITIKHLEVSDNKVARNMRELYSNGRETLGKEFNKAVDKGALELGPMSELVTTMLDLVLRSDVPVSTMLALRGREDYTYTHSMNVSLLASAQAASLGLDEADVRSVGLAGMTHDVGKTTVPESVLTKRSPLTAGEKQMLDNHAIEGARILLRTQGGSGIEAIVAAEHHLPYTANPHLAAQIVAIADTFDSVRSLRPFADRTTLRAALRYMQKNFSHKLNPYLLQRFCLMCGMYMPGDVVHLSTGEVARVVENDAEEGSRPTVEVLQTGAGTAPIGSVAQLAAPHLSDLRIMKEPVLAFANLAPEMIEVLA
jgi:putative nucleotidyltransferase with HDIG domain